MNAIKRATAGVIPLFLILAASLNTPADAQRKTMFVPGAQAESQTTKLTSEIHWYDNLSQAESQARSQGKLVFWMHMLGNLSGTT